MLPAAFCLFLSKEGHRCKKLYARESEKRKKITSRYTEEDGRVKVCFFNARARASQFVANNFLFFVFFERERSSRLRPSSKNLATVQLVVS